MKIEIILTKDQESIIINKWNDCAKKKIDPPSIKELIKLVFEEDGLDGRSAEGIAIRKFLGERGFNLPVKEKKIIELTEENKEFIRNNSSSMTATEMARLIFNNNNLITGSGETRAVLAFKETLKDVLMYKDEKSLEEFKAPRSDDKVIKLVNGIVLNAFNPDKIDGATKKCLSSCINYLNNERFLTEIENYQEANERKMFINNFIRHIYDKPDLTQQDVDILITFSNEVIEHKRIQDQMDILREQQKRLSEDADAKLSMSLVEMINNCTNNLSKSKMTQKNLLAEINEKRSERLKKERSNANSLLNLIAEWKEEETRLKMIKLAEQRKKILGEEVDRLSDMESFKASIFGTTKEELVYGS